MLDKKPMTYLQIGKEILTKGYLKVEIIFFIYSIMSDKISCRDTYWCGSQAKGIKMSNNAVQMY